MTNEQIHRRILELDETVTALQRRLGETAVALSVALDAKRRINADHAAERTLRQDLQAANAALGMEVQAAAGLVERLLKPRPSEKLKTEARRWLEATIGGCG